MVNVNIGVVCVVFFFGILFMGNFGMVSVELSGLFCDGSYVWSFLFSLLLLIFMVGCLCNNLNLVEVWCDLVVVNYEKII